MRVARPIIRSSVQLARLARLARPRFVVLGAGVAAVALVAALTIWFVVAGERDGDDAEAAARVRERAQQLVIDLFSAESAQRGYLLTDDPRFQASFADAQAAVTRTLDELTRIAPARLDGPVAELRAAVSAKLTELAFTVTLADVDARARALDAVRTRAGERAMARSLEALGAIITAQGRVQARHVERRTRQARIAIVVVAGGSLIAVVALLVGIASLRRHAAERTRALAELRQQADELEQRRLALGQTAAQLALANHALARSNRDLDQFAYVASHDLKAPLRGIASLAAWIEEDLGQPLDPKVANHLQLMRARVERLELLIEGILAYARAGRDEHPVQPLAVEAVARKTAELAAPPPEIEVVVAPGPWPTLETASAPLEQVWLNLIGNAVKHGRRGDGGGRIVLACAGPDGDGWRFTVTDDGPGIAPEFHDRVFEMFQRLQSRDKVEGAGIGLAVVRKLVTANGGRVWIESPAAGGVAVHFTWKGKP